MNKRNKSKRIRKIIWISLGVLLLLLVGYGLLTVNSFGKAGWEFVGSGKKYLVVFQNEAELRPTGGFIGAYAVVETGLMPKIEVKDSYTLEWHEAETAPEPVHTLLDDGKWYGGHFFRDANINPDWPSSARELARMYNLNFAEETKFDGVMAVNFGAIEKLLEKIGPVTVAGRELDSTNAFYTLEVLLRPSDAHDKLALNTRKNALKDLAGQMVGKAMNPLNWGGMSSAIQESLDEKDVLLYFADEEVQADVSARGWAGEIQAEAGQDFLGINIANYGGKKSDRYIDKLADYEVEIGTNGKAQAHLTLDLLHREGETIFTGDWFGWVRVYAPKGAKLSTEDEMLESYTENDLQVWSKVVALPAGGRETLSYTYELPQRYKDEYALRVIKQPGADLNLKVDVRSPVQRFWESDDFGYKENHASWDGKVREDMVLRGEILEDRIPPFVTNQHMSDLQTVWIDVSEPLALGRSIVTGNYEIKDLDKTDKQHDEVEVLAAEHFGNIIKLTVSGMTEQFEERYSLTLKNQEDRSGNPMGETTVTIVQRIDN